MRALGSVYVCAFAKRFCVKEHVWNCVAHRHICVGFCMHRMAGLGVVCRILDKVETLPKNGWRSCFFSLSLFFFQRILLKIPIFTPRNQLCTRFLSSVSWKEAKTEKMELLMGFTSPCCCCTARSGQHGNCDECLISKNTSKIKTVPALNSKVCSRQCCMKTIMDVGALMSLTLTL